MKKRTAVWLIGTAALGAYGAIQGRGPFNKIKYKKQHAAVARYMETHYPKSLYTAITETENEWMTIIRRLGQPNIILYIDRAPDGMFVFHEHPAPAGKRTVFR